MIKKLGLDGKTLFMIVLVGAIISPPMTAAASVAGLLIKTFGIDWIIALFRKIKKP